MKKIAIKAFLLTISLIFPLSTLAFADNDQDAIAIRTEHYQTAAPKDKQEALSWLEEKVKIMDKALKEDKLELIHEQSYYLESSVEFLRDKTKLSGKEIDALDELVQIIHFASENDEKETLEEKLPLLKASAETIRKLVK